MALFHASNPLHAGPPVSVFDDDAFAEPFADSEFADCEHCDSAAPSVNEWGERIGSDSHYLIDDGPYHRGDHTQLRPFDWIRHLGFRHSSTHGRHVDRGLPLEGTSWLNRPFHFDWFSGPLMGDDLIENQVAQDNELFAGIRFGWDIDYYWGLESRFGWSNPNTQLADPTGVADNGSYFISDVNVLYYPWGDSKIRPYMLLGAGMARIRFVDAADRNYNTTLLTTPFGGGVQFMQTPSLIWRFEVLDNWSYGSDGVDSMHNISLTAGMEFRLGSRPMSYWPWRASRKFW